MSKKDFIHLRARTEIDSFTQNVKLTFGGGVSGLDVFKCLFYRNFFGEFSASNFILQL